MLHQIGIGVLGPVFRTYEPNRDRLVAVKAFRLEVTPEQARVLAEALERVAELKLAHPALVAPLAAGVEGFLPYLAQEFVVAESLDVAMRHFAPASLEHALPFVAQLAGAIDVAHAAGVHHGALHPRDVFMTPDEARATGFGVVRALERVGLRGPIRRPYSAPERIAGGDWGAAADVFALAAIAYELLTGRRAAGTGEQVAPVLGEVGGADRDALQQVFATALADNPGCRYPDAQTFVAALQSAAGARQAAGSPVQAPLTRPALALGVPQVPIEWSRGSSEAGDREAPQPEPGSEDQGERWVRGRLSDEFSVDSSQPDKKTWSVGEPEPSEVDRGLAGVEAGEDPEPDEGKDEREVELRIGPDSVAGSLFDELELAEVGGEVTQAEPQAPTSEASAGSTNQVAGGDATGDLETRASAKGRELRTSGARGVKSPRLVLPSPAGDPPRRATLPLALTLVVGMLVAFVAGYGLGSLEQAPSPATETDRAVPARADVVLSPEPRGSAVEETPSASGAGEPAPEAASVASPPLPEGRLFVASSPPGAQVTVNGTARGVTPLTLAGVAYGSYTVRVSRSGYELQTREVSISATEPSATVRVELPREATRPTSPTSSSAGSVFVDSRPRGAQVFLDGALVGTTPMLLADVAAGSHEVRIEREGYQRWSATIRVVAAERTRVGASLDRVPR